MSSHPEHEDGWEQTDGKEDTPCRRLRQEPVDHGVDDRRRSPADGPAGLYKADRPAAILVADDFAHQHCAGSPFAAKAETVQRAQNEELFEVLGERAEKREERIPEDGDLQHLHPTETVGECAAEPSAERGNQQRYS